VYIDTGSPVPNIPSKSRGLADQINKLLTDVSPHCGDKRMAQHCTGHSLPNYFVMISLECETKHSNVTLVNKRQK
jgi:hypothetical protein